MGVVNHLQTPSDHYPCGGCHSTTVRDTNYQQLIEHTRLLILQQSVAMS